MRTPRAHGAFIPMVPVQLCQSRSLPVVSREDHSVHYQSMSRTRPRRRPPTPLAPSPRWIPPVSTDAAVVRHLTTADRQAHRGGACAVACCQGERVLQHWSSLGVPSAHRAQTPLGACIRAFSPVARWRLWAWKGIGGWSDGAAAAAASRVGINVRLPAAERGRAALGRCALRGACRI